MALSEKNLKSKSPLNGFLYLSSEDNDNILEKDISTADDGLFTMKELLEMDLSFAKTKYIILSACNTGVTFVPMSVRLGLEDSSFKEEDVEKDLTNVGWVPGVDQVSFVDSFMKKGAQNVYGTLWQADDTMSSIVMDGFISNLVKQGEKPDAIAAHSAALKQFIQDSKADKLPLTAPQKNIFFVPHQPYYWAVGAIFGK